MKELKLNQCQDCGCNGSKIELIDTAGFIAMRGRGKSPRWAFSCPYCRRTAEPIIITSSDQIGRAIPVLIDRWNAINRKNEEGLA